MHTNLAAMRQLTLLDVDSVDVLAALLSRSQRIDETTATILEEDLANRQRDRESLINVVVATTQDFTQLQFNFI